MNDKQHDIAFGFAMGTIVASVVIIYTSEGGYATSTVAGLTIGLVGMLYVFVWLFSLAPSAPD